MDYNFNNYSSSSFIGNSPTFIDDSGTISLPLPSERSNNRSKINRKYLIGSAVLLLAGSLLCGNYLLGNEKPQENQTSSSKSYQKPQIPIQSSRVSNVAKIGGLEDRIS